MNDNQKVEALTELLSNVIHRLEMKMYEIEDPHESHQCEVEADQFQKQMLDILYPKDTPQSVTSDSQTET